MPPHLTPRFRRLALALSATAALAPASPAAPAAAEEPTPQAINAHAEFLAYPTTPPPPAPVKVCVVDTGVDLTTDAAPAVVERYSEFGGTVDDTGGGGIAKHGTYVTGVIASQWDGVGSVGIFPRARIVSVRVFPDKDSGTTVAKYLHALDSCRVREAKVVNLSLSGLEQATGPELAQLENKITNMRTNFGLNVIAAAGNSGRSIGYPAKFAATLAVGATDRTGELCGFSSRGPELDISALGCGVAMSLPSAQLAIGDGTSYSTPVVSGVLAALRAYRPDLSGSGAEHILMTASQSTTAGHVVDAAAAFRRAGLEAIVATPPPTVGVPPLAPQAPASGTEVVARIPQDPLHELGLSKPRIRRARYSHGDLAIVVSNVPDYGRAIFMIDQRRYVRRSGALTIRVKRAPSTIRVSIDVPGVGRTPSLPVKLKPAAQTHRVRTRTRS